MLLFGHSVISDVLQPHGPQPTSLHCPWDFPGKNTGVGWHFLLQRIIPTQGLNPHLLHCRWILYCWGTKEACGIYIHVRLFATAWTVAHKAPLSMGFPRVAIFYSRGPSWPRDQTHVSWIAGSFFTCRAYKKNEFLPFATIWMDLESVMLSEINQWKILCYQSCVESKTELRECIWQKRNRLTESKLVLISGERGRGRNKIEGKMHRDKLLCEK